MYIARDGGVHVEVDRLCPMYMYKLSIVRDVGVHPKLLSVRAVSRCRVIILFLIFSIV